MHGEPFRSFPESVNMQLYNTRCLINITLCTVVQYMYNAIKNITSSKTVLHHGDWIFCSIIVITCRGQWESEYVSYSSLYSLGLT